MTEGERNMSNEAIRKRMRAYVRKYGTAYTVIAREAGIGAPSRYLISRFMNGRQLNAETLTLIDTYLTERGY